MANLALVLATLALAPAAQDNAVFRDEQLRLQFTYPSTWTVERRNKDTATLSLPIEGTTTRARLEISRAAFRSEKETWQLIQQTANRQLRREVVRQWQQEVLGVPMLLTRIRYEENGNAMNALTGLFYTATPLKMLFRLTAPAEDFDKAQFVFTTAMESLRTVDDSELKAEDPSRPAPEPPKPGQRVDTTPKRRVTISDRPQDRGTVEGPVSVPLVVSTRNLIVRMPEGWTVESTKDNTFVAKHPDLAGSVAVEVNSLLDSPAPRAARFKKANESLERMKKVLKREDPTVERTRGAMTLNAVWRNGETDKGRILSLDATVENTTHYAVITYRTEDADAFARERKALEELLDVLSVTPAP